MAADRCAISWVSSPASSGYVCLSPRGRPALCRASGNDGGPLRYRVAHRTVARKKGERPKMEQKMLEGDAPFSV